MLKKACWKCSVPIRADMKKIPKKLLHGRVSVWREYRCESTCAPKEMMEGGCHRETRKEHAQRGN